MDKPFLGGIVVALAVVVAGGALVMAPRMQSPRAKVAELAAIDTERARRLLHQFSDNEERIGVLLDGFAAAGVDPNLPPEDVQRLLEEEDGRRVVEEYDLKLKEVLRATGARTSELDQRYLKAAYGSKWQEHLQPGRSGLGANVSQMSSAIREGLGARERLVEENKSLLNRALQAVESALGQSVGEASGSNQVEPNRLHGIVLFHLAEAHRRESAGRRRAADAYLHRLITLGVTARGLEQERELAGLAGIEERIAQAREQKAQAEAELARLNAAAGELESGIEEMKARIASLQSVAESARSAMERMEEQGARLDYAGGFEQFSSQFNELAARYRDALSEIHRLESGSLRNAQINATGDFLNGPYVPRDVNAPIAPDAGLPGLERDLASASLQVAGAESGVTAAQSEIERLEAMQSEYRERAAIAETKLAALAETAKSIYGDFERTAAEAEADEEKSIGRYNKSIGAFNAAARAAQENVTDAETALTGLSEESRNRAPANLVATDPAEQRLKLSAADAQIRLGALHYRIWSDDERIAAALADLPEGLGLREASPEAWSEKAEAAKTSGIEVLHTAYDAIQNSRGALRGHWTLAAEAAAAANLLALFGEENMRTIAVNAYESVIADQADEAYVQPYVERLRLLKTP